jgi:hypothetical protein
VIQIVIQRRVQKIDKAEPVPVPKMNIGSGREVSIPEMNVGSASMNLESENRGN